MLLYFIIAHTHASKPSKIPNDMKVGRDLYNLYCAGCHGVLELDPSMKEASNSKEDASKQNNDVISKKENRKKESTQKTQTIPTSKKNVRIRSNEPSRLLEEQNVSTQIIIKNLPKTPSMKDKTYSTEEWIDWVLHGQGTMPSYSEVLHSTDALKIKTYLDGL